MPLLPIPWRLQHPSVPVVGVVGLHRALEVYGMGEPPTDSRLAGTEWLVPKSPVAFHSLGLLPVCIPF